MYIIGNESAFQQFRENFYFIFNYFAGFINYLFIIYRHSGVHGRRPRGCAK